MEKKPPPVARIALALLLSFAIFAAAAGTITTKTFASPVLRRDWSYSLYLPDGYEGSGLRYPVLYLLHGHGGNRGDWPAMHLRETVDGLIARGEIPPLLIVMPDAGTSWYVDRRERMETAFVSDLLPAIERDYRALASREGRMIAGFSMGGYGAMRFALVHPDLFAAAALLSPAIYDPEPPPNSSARRAGVFGAEAFDAQAWRSLNYPALWEAYLARHQPVPMYVFSGDDDEYFIEFEVAKFYELLRRQGQPAELRIVDGGHDGALWEAALPDAMRYMGRHAARPSPAAAMR
jgi:enterochelin esterase-like enzyme